MHMNLKTFARGKFDECSYMYQSRLHVHASLQGWNIIICNACARIPIMCSIQSIDTSLELADHWTIISSTSDSELVTEFDFSRQELPCNHHCRMCKLWTIPCPSGSWVFCTQCMLTRMWPCMQLAIYIYIYLPTYLSIFIYTCSLPLNDLYITLRIFQVLYCYRHFYIHSIIICSTVKPQSLNNRSAILWLNLVVSIGMQKSYNH